MKRVAIAAIVLALDAANATAAQRTFVKSDGSDSNPCSLVAPCRGFAAAITHTDPNGEIIVLDSAGYGAVTVTTNVSIIAPPGIYGGLSVFNGQDGVTVNGSGAKVVLRGLSINGQGGDNGVNVIQAGQVHIENCVISNMAIDGVHANAGAVYVANSVLRGNEIGVHVTGTSAKVYVDDTRIAENTTRGVFVEAGTIAINRSQIERNAGIGMDVTPANPSTVRAFVRDSSFAGNAGNGLQALAGPAGDIVDVTVAQSAAWRNGLAGFSGTSSAGIVNFVLSGSVASENVSHGYVADGAGTTASVSGSTLSRNETGMIQSNSALLNSHGNNAANNNGITDKSGSITNVGLQ